MRDYPQEYHYPITIGLLVIRVSCKVSSWRDPYELQRELSEQLRRSLTQFNRASSVTFWPTTSRLTKCRYFSETGATTVTVDDRDQPEAVRRRVMTKVSTWP